MALRPEMGAFVSEDWKQKKIQVFLAQSFFSLLKLFWKK